MAVVNRVSALVLNTFNSATMTPAFQPINATGTERPCFLIRIVNASNRDVVISYDGKNEHDYVASGATLQISFQANGQPNNFNALLAQGSIVYVTGNPGVGTIAFAGYYQQQQ